MVQQALTFQDLTALDSSPDAVRSAFQKKFGKNPDGIALNDQTYFNAVQPPITQTYGHPCYKTLGSIDYTEGATTSGTSAILGSNYAVNNSDEEATITLTVNGSWTSSTSVSSSVTAGMSFSAEITLEGVFKLGESFNMSVTAGQSKTETVQQGSSATVQVTVPPRSRKKVTMVGTLKQEKVNFSAPISVNGMFGANFPDRVNGHYFWFTAAYDLLPKTSGTLSGVITHASAFDVQTEIGAAEPIAVAARAA
jgi:hypothetical protein